MPNYYIPALFLVPGDNCKDVRVEPYGLVLRKWDVTIFDLATLETKHSLHIPYEMMTIFLRNCNMEFVISAPTVEKAKLEARVLKAMLYINGVAPHILPFISTHSINDYAGINCRDSEFLKDTLPNELKEGLTSKDGKVEVWPFELTLQTIIDGNLILTDTVFKQAVANARVWSKLNDSNAVLRIMQDSLTTAPLIVDKGQSILHIWTAIESIFPSVNQEISFRVALYLSQLNKNINNRYTYFIGVKKAYKTRSKIAHGNFDEVTIEEWRIAWDLLKDVCRSILERGEIPKEEDLLKELLL
ncbi:hypothetical protein MTBGP_11970 [Moorella thermoacetica]|uniref:hypothetical protein n=1 Tax=Neomoorella thermoacetica TaxID=1525 RepID=UPI0030CE29ED